LYFLQRLGVKNVPFLHLQDQSNDVSPAKGLSVIVIRLDVGMPLGQQIGELAVHLDVARLIQPEGGEGQRDQQDGRSVTPEKSNIALDDAVGETFLRGLSRHGVLLRSGQEWYR